jgi:nucleoid-associated protein YgaU
VESAPANTSSARKSGKLWLVFILLLCSAAGAAYVGLQPMSLWEKVAPPQKAETKAPKQQALAPAPIPPSFDAVNADESGSLVTAGKAEPGANVLLQNQAQTLGEAKADEQGEWVLMPDRPLPPGNYDLSLQEVLPRTQERVAGLHHYALTIAPREKPAPAPAQIAAASPPKAETAPPAAPAPAGLPQARPAVAAVKRGDTLWAIAQHFYGKGIRYGEIAGANKDQIKNPNLIFPNQQLAIPGEKAP